MEIIDKVIIPHGEYSGYIWQSDSKQPIVLNKIKSVERIFLSTENPFVIEGLLYDINNEISYSIKHIDGKYIFMKYELRKIEGEIQKKSYIASFDNAPGLLSFNQYWREKLDSQCGMNTLCPEEFIFVGFNQKGE